MVQRKRTLYSAGIILLAVFLAYVNSLQGVFVYDDFINIVNNPCMRALSTAVSNTSRPLTNLTFFLQYKLGLTHAAHFHLVSLLLHACNAIFVFWILWQVARELDPDKRLFVSLSSALLWGVHPIHTESVTYIVQRAEVLSATFLFLGIILGLEYLSKRRTMFLFLVPFCFIFAYLSKPTAVSAPFLFLVLGTMFNGGVVRTWRTNRLVYILSFASLLVPLLLLSGGNESSTSAGFSMSALNFGEYMRSQPRAVALYVYKLIWPMTLLIDYGYDIDRGASPFILGACLLAASALILRVSGRGSVARTALGWFFFSLLPVLVVPLSDLFAEHRLYVPSFGVAVLFSAGLFELCRRLPWAQARRGRAFFGIVLVLAAGLAVRSVLRNKDYRDVLVLWKQVVVQRPENIRGHLGVGSSLAARGDMDGAEASFRAAVSLYQQTKSEFLRAAHRTDYAYACFNLSSILGANGDIDESAIYRKEAEANGVRLRRDPN